MELITLSMTDDLNALRDALEVEYHQTNAAGKVERNTDRIAREILRAATDSAGLLTVQDVVNAIVQHPNGANSTSFDKDDWEKFVKYIADALAKDDPSEALRGVWKMDSVG